VKKKKIFKAILTSIIVESFGYKTDLKNYQLFILIDSTFF